MVIEDLLKNVKLPAIYKREGKDCYYDTYRKKVDLPDYNVVKANEFKTDYPGVTVKNLFPLVAEERMQKDEDEIELTKKAIALTKEGLCNVMANLKPGMKEYQAQADFEYIIRRGGAEWTAFPTIAGSGMKRLSVCWQRKIYLIYKIC